ncbi:hypothetical protein C5O24_06890, partial [Paramuribaculum intestinale]
PGRRDDKRRQDSSERFDRRDRQGRHRDDERHESAPRENQENPLARRRNPEALKSITGRGPSLPPQHGENVVMRSRRGWRNSSNDSDK